MLISLDTNDSVPLVEQVFRGISRLVDERKLRHGSRLPSIRDFARDHRISRFTVVQAYDKLVASGYLDSRRGSGFYVARPLAAHKPESSTMRLDRAVDFLWLVRHSTEDYRRKYMPGCGWLPGSWQDTESIEKGLRSVARAGAAHLMEGYGSASGYVPLRQDIQRRMNEVGVFADLSQILTTNGVVDAIDLVGRYMLKPGDRVLVDDPGYFHTFGHLQAMDAEIIGVPWTPQGPDTQAMEELADKHRPKLFVTNSVMHNPTGASISQSCAYQVLRLAERHDFMILEDVVYATFHAGMPVRLAALDQLDRVIYVNSFSKTISPRLRVGYLAARREIVQDLIDLKLITGMSTSELNERVIHQILYEGAYRKHLTRVKARIDLARQEAVPKLEECGLKPYIDPNQGMFIWARFEHIEDTAGMATEADERDILLAPGKIFRPHQEPSPWLRFNVAYLGDPAVYDFLKEYADRH